MIPVDLIDTTVAELEQLQDQVFEREERIWLARLPACVSMGWNDTAAPVTDLPIVAAARGGGTTIHAPGQIVAVVVCDLGRRRIPPKSWTLLLLAAAQRTLDWFGIASVLDADRQGVFVPGGQKIASVGVRKVRQWTRWGMSLNVTEPAGPLPNITICNDPTIEFTSMREQGSPAEWITVAQIMGQLLPAIIEEHSQR